MEDLQRILMLLLHTGAFLRLEYTKPQNAANYSVQGCRDCYAMHAGVRAEGKVHATTAAAAAIRC